MSSGVSSLVAWWACGAAGMVAAGCWWLAARCHPRRGHANQLVVVTGCDSGLGFSLALRAHSSGLTVLAACYNAVGVGARRLRELCGEERLYLSPLEVRDVNSVQRLVETAKHILHSQPGVELRALVNNAGVMVFGEFEWQTEQQIRHQVDVNVLGTMRVTRAFCPLIRRHKGRIITVTSHCADQTLPGLAVYGATKAALKGWSDGLRVEQGKYGVKVITLVPGYFMMNSNLMEHHDSHVQEMQYGMTEEDCTFFGDYFDRFHNALKVFTVRREPTAIDDERLHAMFDDAVLSPYPHAHYRNSPLRYTVYHWLFKVMPVHVRDLLMVRFMSMPKWQPSLDP